MGDYKFDAKNRVLEWSVPLVDKDSPDGAMEFVVANLNPSELFPIQISFTADSLICQVEPVAVANATGEVPFSKRSLLSTETYQIVEEAE